MPTEVAELPTLAALPSVTATLLATATPNESPTPTPTNTLTATASPSDTPSVTPSATITDTPTPTASNTPLPSDTPAPTADNEGLLALVALAAKATVLPPQFLPTSVPTIAGIVATAPIPVSCVTPPSGGFAAIYASDPTLAQQLGCATPSILSVSSASQNYQIGEMVWVAGPPPVIYVLFGNGQFRRYDDTFNAAFDPNSGGETPPNGLREPVRGFGKVWRTFGEVRGIGWAVTDETGGQATIQIFERGQMVYLPQRATVFVLANDSSGVAGTWRAFAGSF
ncbi:MAG: hypothetical protein R3E39_04185 [Anaerolineae bacterium]